MASGKIFGWHRLLQSTLGWSPEIEFLPPLPAAVILYVSFFLIGQFFFQMTRMLIPHPIKEYLMDFVKTMTLCCYPFGHGIMRKFYGEPGYMCAMIPTIMLTLLTFTGAAGNPVGVWVQVFRKHISFAKCIAKNIFQVGAGFAAYRLGMFVLNLELHPVYVDRLNDYYNQFCKTDLNVPIYLGFLIEFCGVIYVSWFDCQLLFKDPVLDQLIKVVNAGLLVVSCVHLTGMYMHPAMATGHTWGCGETTRPTHVLIYWVGPMIGAWLAVQLSKKFSINLHKKAGKAKQASSLSQTKTGNSSVQETTNGQLRKRKNGRRVHYS